MILKHSLGSALVLALVACGGTKNEVTVSGNDQASLNASPAGVATMTFVDLEGGFRIDQLPNVVQVPGGDALMVETPQAMNSACTTTSTTTVGTTVTTTVTFNNCKAANGNVMTGTLVMAENTNTATTSRAVTTTYDLTTKDSTLTKTWTYKGSKVFTLNRVAKTASVTVPTGGTGVLVTYTDTANTANNKSYTYAPYLTADWATVGQFKLWGTYSFTQTGGTAITASILQANPLVWNFGGISACCYPISGTLSLSTGAQTADAVFGPTCGALKLNGGAIAMPACS